MIPVHPDLCVTGTGRGPIRYYALMGGRPDPLLRSGLTGERSDPTVDNGCCGDLTASGFTDDMALSVTRSECMNHNHIYIERDITL